MNFRKFISGVSALAIAASAFAGMAVTASADYSVAADGTKTWDFADYTDENTDYTSVFSVTGSATISTNGINMNLNNSQTTADASAKFTAPDKGTVTVTVENTHNSNYLYFYAYDTDGTTQMTYINRFPRSDGTKTASFPVEKDGIYTMLMKSNVSNKTCPGYIKNVVFYPAYRTVPVFNERTALELDNASLFDVIGTRYGDYGITQTGSRITFGRSLDETLSASNYVEFTAPNKGKLEFTFQNGDSTQNRHAVLDIKDSDSTSLYYKDINTGGAEDSSYITVEKDAKYYFYGYINTKYAVSGILKNVYFTPYFDVTNTTADTNGSISLSKTADIPAGEEVTVTVDANDGYVLDKLYVGGVDVTSSVSNDTYTFNISADTEVSATFKAAELVAISNAKTWYPSDFNTGEIASRASRYSKDSTMVLTTGVNGGSVAGYYIQIGNSSKGPMFHTNVPGIVTVKAFNSGADRNITIQGTTKENAIDHNVHKSANSTSTTTARVSAGDVQISASGYWYITEITFTPAGTATLNSISNIHEFTKGTDDPVTAAVLNITVADLSTRIDVSFDGGDAKTTGTYLVGPVKIGVIVPGKDLGITADNDNDLFAVSAHID